MGTSASATLTDATGPRAAPTRVTSALFFVCLAVFLGLAAAADRGERALLLPWFYRPAYGVWHGAYWSLVTSAFVHLELWHLLGNLYWLWILGCGVERAIGGARFLGLVLAA